MMVTTIKQDQDEAYSAVQEKSFTGVPGLPTIKDRYGMYEEACNVATSVYVRYYWDGYFGLLAIITGGNNYMELTTKVYVDLTENPEYNSLIYQVTSDYQQYKNTAEVSC